MRQWLSKAFKDSGDDVAAKAVAIYAILFAGNAAAWIWAAIAFRHRPLLLGTALLAYSLGLRHAVDADHIAAIDNVTRKLIQGGKKPVAAGLMFSLGHSTVVVAGSIAIAAATLTLQHRFQTFRTFGGILGTIISALFLFAIGIVNLSVLRSVYRTFLRVRAGGAYAEEDLNVLLSGRGFLNRLFRPIFTMIDSSWDMYPLGLLFGLGFDTATEIGLLGLSAAEASKGLSLVSILVFPVLFAAGMSLIDTTDNVLVLFAYGWAFVKPVRKLYYNMTITCVSALVAIGVGGMEVLGLIAVQLHLRGAFWNAVVRVTNSFGVLGLSIIGLFALSWIVSIAIYRWRRFDDLEAQELAQESSS